MKRAGRQADHRPRRLAASLRPTSTGDRSASASSARVRGRSSTCSSSGRRWPDPSLLSGPCWGSTLRRVRIRWAGRRHRRAARRDRRSPVRTAGSGRADRMAPATGRPDARSRLRERSAARCPGGEAGSAAGRMHLVLRALDVRLWARGSVSNDLSSRRAAARKASGACLPPRPGVSLLHTAITLDGAARAL